MIALAGATLPAAPLPAALLHDLGPPPGPAAAPEAFPTARDRAVAFGYLLDSPRPPAVIEESLVIAEELRRRYGIVTGDPEADRLAAARRAKTELIDALTFSPQEVEEAARSLGYSLEPAQCADFCENVYRLSIVELQKRALKAFAEGRPGPGRIRATPAGSTLSPEKADDSSPTP